MRAELWLRIASLAALVFSAMSALDTYAPIPAFCAPGAGCDVVHSSAIGEAISLYLPALGLLTYTITFTGTLVQRRGTHRFAAIAAIAGGLGGASFLLLQGFVIKAWCWICVGADASAILGALGAIPLLRSPAPRDGSIELRSAWWAAWLASIAAPMAWAATFPDPLVPEAIRELYRDGPIDVVEIADFGCPHCRAMHPALRAALRERPDVRVTPVMVAMAPERREAIAAYHCANEQGEGAAMADRLFHVESFDRDTLAHEAQALGFEPERFHACLDDPRTRARVQADSDRADRAHVIGVPMVFVEDRQLIGFDPDSGAEPYRIAIREGGARRVRWQPGLALAVLCGVVVLWGLRRRTLTARHAPAP